MKIQDLIGNILKSSPELGTFTLPDLLKYARSGSISGIAAVNENEKQCFLAVIAGEPEGAIYIDEKGTLYGDKAVMLFTGPEMYVLYDVKPDVVEAVAMGCRIFEKSHLKPGQTYELPEIGKKSQGMGVLSLVVRQNTLPQNGVRVSIRRDGKIVGSDITTEDGSVGFKVLHGKYDCIVQDRNQRITTFHIRFDESHSQIPLDL